MRKVTKICLWVLVLDAAVYWLLFYSGLVLPFINPSVEEYNAARTSFARHANQCMVWTVAHFPVSFLIAHISERFLVLSAVQYPLIIYGVHALIQARKGRGVAVAEG